MRPTFTVALRLTPGLLLAAALLGAGPVAAAAASNHATRSVASVRGDDADGDGVSDMDDNCPSDPNPTQLDTDADDLGDACDPDDDDDAVLDMVDNCPTAANASQDDIDADGLGDACDPFLTFQPDAQIALASAGPFAGVDVYAAAATPGQTRARTGVQRGRTYVYVARFVNDGAAFSSFTLKATESGSSAYSIRYLVGGLNRTAAIKAGTYETTELGPGGSMKVRIEVTVGATAPLGSKRSVVLRASGDDPAAVDVVRAVTKR
jgi:hypothetical protein